MGEEYKGTLEKLFNENHVLSLVIRDLGSDSLLS